jgi:hypothetical protein
MNEKKRQAKPDANRDPLTGEPGAHPVGVGLGSAGGAAIGAVVGSLAGPAGTALGAAVGGVAGGLTGKGVAEEANPTVEARYWRESYPSRPYARAGTGFETYEPAYRLGWEGAGRYGELNWEKAEPRLREDWRRAGSAGSLDWDAASPAVRDAWDRIRDGVDYSQENI